MCIREYANGAQMSPVYVETAIATYSIECRTECPKSPRDSLARHYAPCGSQAVEVGVELGPFRIRPDT